jgi:hypothetical protein
MMKNRDMPAMPLTDESGGLSDLTCGTHDSDYLLQEGRNFSTGLTKREHFAAMAMQGLAAGGHDNAMAVVSQAVIMADALLEELEAKDDE